MTATVFLVRHAHAAERGDWDGDDVDRPLTGRGLRQADALVEVLAGEKVTRVLSSPAVRCRQTVEPLAAARGLRVEDTPGLLEGAPFAEAVALGEHAGAGAVLCTHGDVIADLVLDLQRRRVPLEGGPRWSKGSTWVLALKDGAVVRARYLPPPHA